MANKKISELTKVASTNATDEFVLSRGGTNVSIEAQNLTMASASYALTASYAVKTLVEISSSFAQTASSSTSASLAQLALEAISSSYAISSSLAQLALETISASYAVTASHALNNTSVSSSYATTASYAGSTTILSSSASTARDVIVDSISGSSTALSASLTTTDQAISSSVANLSGSTSDARNVIATTVSASDAFLRTRIDGDYIEFLNLEITVNNLSGSTATANTELSASLTTTDKAISSSVVILSGSASDARTALSSSLTATEQQLSSSLAGTNANQNTLIVNNLNQAFVTLPAQITAKADTTYVDNQNTALSASVAALSGSASDARNALTIESASYASTASFIVSSGILGPLGVDSVAKSQVASISTNSVSCSYAITAPFLSGSASDARNVLASDSTALSSSLTTTDQSLKFALDYNTNSISTNQTNIITVAQNVTNLSGSASTARNAIVSDYSPKVSGSFAQYISRIDQTGAADTIHFVTHNTNTIEQNISLDANDYEITVTNAGKYELKSTTQWQRDTETTDNVSLWIQVNGTNVGFSTSTLSLTDNFITPLYAQWILDLDAGDVVRIAWSSTEGTASIVKLAAFTNPTRPMTPSANTHLIKIGD